MTPKSAKAGFSLGELLIVVVVFAILAAVAVPRFTSSAEEAKASAVQANLGVLRSSLELYKLQHGAKYPGYPVDGGTPTSEIFTSQMLKSSQDDHSTAAVGTPGYPFGPYVQEVLPNNAANSLNSVLIIDDVTAFPTAADNTTGWVYKPLTGQIRANSTGRTPSGARWFEL